MAVLLDQFGKTLSLKRSQTHVLVALLDGAEKEPGVWLEVWADPAADQPRVEGLARSLERALNSGKWQAI